MERKLSPAGIASFETIRTQNMYYVDKTPFIHQLVSKPWASYFFSRPRRFGKSLFMDTLHCLYEGKRELFDGLYIYDKWDWSKTHPVIKLDLSNTEPETAKEFRLAACHELGQSEFATDSLVGPPDLRLGELVFSIYKKTHQKVVILIDEYDAPLVSLKDKPEEYQSAHKNMRGILKAIKSKRKYIEFVCITGILKLDQHDFFSAANIFNDISLLPEYNEICGYTEEELLHTFKPELERDDLDPEININALREWYDGYRWGAPVHLYNPNDILKTFERNKISSWWIIDGSSTVAIRRMSQEKDFAFEDYKTAITEEFLYEGVSLNDPNIELATVLFQSGYVTIKTPDPEESLTSVLQLEPPNLEVKIALARIRLNILSRNNVGKTELSNLLKLLEQQNFKLLENKIRYIFSQCVYDEQPQDLRERHFSIIMRSMFLACGLNDIQTEVHTQEGRADMVVHLNNNYYIMEFKLLGVGGVQPGDAIKQLKERRYASRYKGLGRIFLLGFEFTIEHMDDKSDTSKVTLAKLDSEEVLDLGVEWT